MDDSHSVAERRLVIEFRVDRHSAERLSEAFRRIGLPGLDAGDQEASVQNPPLDAPTASLSLQVQG